MIALIDKTCILAEFADEVDAADDTLENYNDVINSIERHWKTESGFFVKPDILGRRRIWLIDGETVKRAFSSVTDAAVELDLHVAIIKDAIEFGIETRYGFFVELVYAGEMPKRQRIKANVLQVSKYDGSVLAKFKNAREAEQKTGIGNIYRCLKGKMKSAGGYYWRYEK